MKSNRATTAFGKAAPVYWCLSIFALAAFVFFIGSIATQAAAKGEAFQEASVSTQKLAGHWQLNKDQSDDPRQKMQAAREDSGGGSGGGGYGGGGERGGRSGGGRGQGAGMMDDLQLLTIDQTGSDVKVTGKSGRVLAQYPSSDTSSANTSGEGEGQRTTTSQWNNGQLSVVTQGPRGKTTRTYSLSPDGKQLYVTTKMENERFKQPVTFRFVYGPASGGTN